MQHRLGQHLARLRGRKHHSPIMQAAFDKYGEESFECFVLEVVGGDLIEAEQRWLDLLEPSYNIRTLAVVGGQGGRPLSDRQKLALRLGPLNRQPLTEETKRKIGENSGAARRGKPSNMSGRTHSVSAREKLRRAKLGTTLSDDARAKITASNQKRHLQQRSQAENLAASLGDRVTTERAAVILGLTVGTVRNALSQKRLPFETYQGRRLILLSDLAVYRNRRKRL